VTSTYLNDLFLNQATHAEFTIDVNAPLRPR
jgi:hypothetical protein